MSVLVKKFLLLWVLDNLLIRFFCFSEIVNNVASAMGIVAIYIVFDGIAVSM